MDSGVSPNPWAPFDGYTRDCSKEICSLHCPEWCAMIFPPPPNKDDDSGNSLSPLIIALITALATAFLLLTYYTIISKFCRRGGSLRGGADNDDAGADLEGGSRDQEQWPPQPEGSRGLEEALIKSIAICKYSKRDGAVEGTDCSVCLSEFQEEESLRVLPKCNHAFHVPCIDKWLKAQSNCPLCRSNITPLNPHPSPPPASATAMLETAGPQNSPGSRSTSLQIHRPSDAVVMMVEDLESVRREEIVAVSFVAQRKTKTILEAHPRRDEERERGKASQNIIEILAVEEDEGSDSSSQHRGLRSIDHALRGDEEDEKGNLQIRNFCRSSSTGNGSTIRIEGQLEEGDEEGSGNRITG